MIKMSKVVLLEPELHRNLNILRAAKGLKSFNEVIEFIYAFYYKREVEGTELEKIAVATAKGQEQ